MSYTKADIMKKLTPVKIQFDDKDERSEFCEIYMYEIFKKIPEEFKNDKEIVTYALSNCYGEYFNKDYREDAVKILKSIPKKLREPEFFGELIKNQILLFSEVIEAFNDQKLVNKIEEIIQENSHEKSKAIIANDAENGTYKVELDEKEKLVVPEVSDNEMLSIEEH